MLQPTGKNFFNYEITFAFISFGTVPNALLDPLSNNSTPDGRSKNGTSRWMWREGRHATLGQPRYALIWNTTTLHYFPGYQCHLDKCPFEVIMTDENQMDQYTKKPTQIQCTDEGMANELSLLCPGDHHHLPLEGNSPGVGNRAAASAVYQGVLCSCIVQEIINLIIYQEYGQTLMTMSVFTQVMIRR